MPYACAWCCIGLVLEDRSLQPPTHAGNAGFGGGSQSNAGAALSSSTATAAAAVARSSHTHTHNAHNAPLSLRHAELLVSVSETLCPSGHTSATLNPSDAGPLAMSSAVTQSGRRTIGRGEGDCKEGFTRGSVRERARSGSADGWGRSKISKACAVM